jgi:hypothetical protein
VIATPVGGISQFVQDARAAFGSSVATDGGRAYGSSDAWQTEFSEAFEIPFHGLIGLQFQIREG